MNNRTRNLTLLAALTALTACGLQSGSNRFGFDGVGDPRPPDGNVIPGKFHGTFEVTRFTTLDPKITPLFGNDISLVQGLFSRNPVEGLAGLPLLVISTMPPPRQPGPANCFEDLGVFPELGGNLQFVDVGPTINWRVTSANDSSAVQAVNRDADANLNNPQTDQILYVSKSNQLRTFEYGYPQTMTWAGGTLGPKGFFSAPARTDTTSTITFPTELVSSAGTGNPTINGVDLYNGGQPLPDVDSYDIQWQPTPAGGDMGVEIIVQIYGPANLPAASTPDKPAMNDIPYFNRLGQLVCLANESDGLAGFTLQRAQVQQLLAHVKQTTAYQKSTEDATGNGSIDPGEDGNHNSRIDKIYGAVLILNRRVENVVKPCLNGTSPDCTEDSPVFISGNATKMTHTSWVVAE